MIPKKVLNTKEIADKIKELRLSHPKNGKILTANDLSVMISNNRALVSQIESRRLKNIKKQDILSIFSILFDVDDTEAEKLALNHLKMTAENSSNSSNNDKNNNSFSWLNDSKWDNWDKYNDTDIDSGIELELKHFINYITLTIKNSPSKKIKYIAWETLKILNKNCHYNFILFSLLNNIKLFGLEGLTNTQRNLEINKLYDIFSRYSEYDYNNGLENITNTALQSALSGEISIVTDSINILYQLNSNLTDIDLITKYNNLITLINEQSKQFGFSNIQLQNISKCSPDILTHKIANVYMPELQSLMLELTKQNGKLIETMQENVEVYFNGLDRELFNS